MNRNYEIEFTASVVASADVVVEAPPASATASAPAPQVVIHNLEDAGFDLQWLRMSEGGAWMVRVYDREGKFTDGSIQDDPVDALLAVAERLLPESRGLNANA
jgi:hypothetical protein